VDDVLVVVDAPREAGVALALVLVRELGAVAAADFAGQGPKVERLALA
jgi:hypothetical protein